MPDAVDFLLGRTTGISTSTTQVSNAADIRAHGTRDGAAFGADYWLKLAMEGRLFVSSDADENDLIIGQTSFAITTPSLLLSVASGTTVIPRFLNLAQTSIVAGGAIDVIVAIDTADRYSSGGTSEKILPVRTDAPIATTSTLRSGATATSTYGIRLYGITVGQDVSSAEGARNDILWVPEMPYLLVGPASLLVFTYAATTGPSWLWSIGWAEIPSARITS